MMYTENLKKGSPSEECLLVKHAEILNEVNMGLSSVNKVALHTSSDK